MAAITYQDQWGHLLDIEKHFNKLIVNGALHRSLFGHWKFFSFDFLFYIFFKTGSNSFELGSSLSFFKNKSLSPKKNFEPDSDKDKDKAQLARPNSNPICRTWQWWSLKSIASDDYIVAISKYLSFYKS